MTNNNKFSYNESIFTDENDISYYLLGAFITDGNVYSPNSCNGKKYYSCELKSADHDWLQQIANMCGKKLELKKANNSKCIRLRIHNTIIGEWLISNNCIPNKTLTVKFPNIPSKYIPDFIRGCWDGDGSLSIINRSNGYKEPKLQLYSASKNFIYSLQEKLTIYNIISHIYLVKMQDHKMANNTIITAKNQLYQMSIGGKSCKIFAEKIYYPGHRISLARKQEKAHDIVCYYNNK